MARTEDATERSPLLDSEHGRLDADDQPNGYADENNEQITQDVPLAGESSTGALLAVMGATWVGVFLAALGM
jgi:hypothetical protein